jgi:hypothetical protein
VKPQSFTIELKKASLINQTPTEISSGLKIFFKMGKRIFSRETHNKKTSKITGVKAKHSPSVDRAFKLQESHIIILQVSLP